jgi:hypothetical protein
MPSGIPFRNLGMFEDLCGKDAIRNVILVTTMWSQVRKEVGERREAELKGRYWKSMLAHGSSALRFLDSFESTWDIIDVIVSKTRPVSFSSTLEETSLPESPSTVDHLITSSKVQGRRITASEISHHDFVIV